jgi:hypothetical protein
MPNITSREHLALILHSRIKKCEYGGVEYYDSAASELICSYYCLEQKFIDWS